MEDHTSLSHGANKKWNWQLRLVVLAWPVEHCAVRDAHGLITQLGLFMWLGVRKNAKGKRERDSGHERDLSLSLQQCCWSMFRGFALVRIEDAFPYKTHYSSQ